MAIYRLCVKNGTVGKGLPHAEYISREGRYSKGKMREELVYKESGNMPRWVAGSDLTFWENADLYERVNGRVYREFEISLPNELKREEQINLIKEFAAKEVGNNHPYSFAIHEKIKDGIKNAHCHFMFTERKLDGIERDPEQFFKRGNSQNPQLGGTRKDESWKKKEKLLEVRKSWELLTNSYLEKSGFEERVDSRSLKAQRDEAVKQGDLFKAELLDREPINISGKILSKPERVLSEIERLQLENFRTKKAVKKEKEQETEKSKSGELSKEELIKKVTFNIKSSKKENIEKQVINLLSRGEYYQNLRAIKEMDRDMKVHGSNEYSKKLRKDLVEKTETIGSQYINTAAFKRQYAVLEESYENQKTKYISELKEKYSYDYFVERTNDKLKYIDALDKKFSKMGNVDLEVKKLELTSVLADKNLLRKEAISYLTGHEISRVINESIAAKNRLKKLENNLSVSKLMGKDESGDTEEKQELLEKIRLNDRRYDELLKVFATPKGENLLREKMLELNRFKEKELAACEKQLKEKQVHENPIARYIEIKAEAENLKKLLKISQSKESSTEENEKLFHTSTKLHYFEQYLSMKEKEMESLGKRKIRELAGECIEKSKANQEKLEKETARLEKGLKLLEGDGKIEMLAINYLTKGEYLKLHSKVISIEKEIGKTEEELKNTGFLNFVKRKELSSKIEISRENQVNLKISKDKLRANIGRDMLHERVEKITESMEKAKEKIQKEIRKSEARRFKESAKISVGFECLKNNFEKYRDSHSLRLGRNISYLAGKLSSEIDDQESGSRNANKINLKDKEQKREEVEI